MKAIVLAGGQGTRLVPYAKILPKPLMPMGDRPILELLLLKMKAAGITDVVLTVGHLAELLKAFFQDGSQWGLHIEYCYEERPLGTAGAISAVSGLDETFLVMNGDVLTTLDLRELVRFHGEQKAAASIASHKRQVHIDLGVLQHSEGCWTNGDVARLAACSYREQCRFWQGGCGVVGYHEKPEIDYVVSMGIYVFEPRVLNYIPKMQYLNFPELVLKLLAAGETVLSFPFDGYWKDLGSAGDYEQAVQDFSRMEGEFLAPTAPSQPPPNTTEVRHI